MRGHTEHCRRFDGETGMSRPSIKSLGAYSVVIDGSDMMWLMACLSYVWAMVIFGAQLTLDGLFHCDCDRKA